ncbi:MAG: hypothetical protein FWE89_03155 [Syntrophaceae bacterium]|nr:hypothetical protein [Syntrophaceae bacterium]
MLFSILAFSGGCAKPPEAEQLAAMDAMDTSLAADAEKFAADELDTAKKIWKAAETQMKKKNYKEAKQGYIDAKAAFEKAAAAVAAGRKAVIGEITAALTSLNESWIALTLDAEANKLEQKLNGEQKDAWMSDTFTFADTLEAAKDMLAAEPLEARAKVGELRAFVDKWDTTFAEVTAIPDKPAPNKKTRR